MDMPTTQRGRELLSGSQRFARKPGWLARITAPGFGKSDLLPRLNLP